MTADQSERPDLNLDALEDDLRHMKRYGNPLYITEPVFQLIAELREARAQLAELTEERAVAQSVVVALARYGDWESDPRLHAAFERYIQFRERRKRSGLHVNALEQEATNHDG